jgi:hypothetical protein
MRKPPLILALLVAFAVPIAARVPPPPGGPPPEYVLKEVLGFGDEQLASFRDLAQARASAAELAQQPTAKSMMKLAILGIGRSSIRSRSAWSRRRTPFNSMGKGSTDAATSSAIYSS